MRKLFIGMLFLPLSAVSASNGSTDDAIEFLKTRMAEIKGEITGEEISGDLPDPKCGTPVTVAIYAMMSQRYDEELKTLVQRPDYLPDTLGGENILVHYATVGTHAPYQVNVDVDPANGVPDYIDSTLYIFEYVWNYVTVTLGYDTPPLDNGLGGDNRYDVYVENLGQGFFGFTSPDVDVGQQRVSSFISIENDFNESQNYRNRPLDAVKVTAAHEFFHAVQFGYDALEFDFDDPDDWTTYKPWWLEASATWMEDVIYDDINDYLGYLPFYYGYSWMGLGTFSYNYGDPRAFHPYASCVWPIYLTEKYGVEIVKDIWERCGTIAGYNTLHATNDALLSRSSSLSTGFLEFSVWNFHTGDFADPVNFFSEGNLFPEMDTATYVGQLVDYPRNLGNVLRPPEHLGANFIVIRSGFEPGGVQVNFDGRDLSNASWHVAILGYSQGESEWIDMLVEGNTGDGSEEWRDWNFFDNVVVIPTVSGLAPLYNQFTYSGRVSYDATLIGEGDPNPDFKLMSAYPSPFIISSETSSMRIPYSLDKRYSKVQMGIWIYDASGGTVAEIPKTAIPSSGPGLHHSGALWYGKNDNGEYVASGIYIVHMEAEGKSSTTKIAVVNNFE